MGPQGRCDRCDAPCPIRRLRRTRRPSLAWTETRSSPRRIRCAGQATSLDLAPILFECPTTNFAMNSIGSRRPTLQDPDSWNAPPTCCSWRAEDLWRSKVNRSQSSLAGVAENRRLKPSYLGLSGDYRHDPRVVGAMAAPCRPPMEPSASTPAAAVVGTGNLGPLVRTAWWS